MPVVHRVRDVKICIYADDEAPPHFHVRSPRTSCKVTIENLQLIVGRFDRADYADAIAWASRNIALLRRTWSELNERD